MQRHPTNWAVSLACLYHGRWYRADVCFSSLHWIILLSNCSFLCNGVYKVKFKLSICDVIVIQKISTGDGKLHFFGRDYILLTLFAQKYIFGQRYMRHLNRHIQSQKWTWMAILQMMSLKIRSVRDAVGLPFIVRLPVLCLIVLNKTFFTAW